MTSILEQCKLAVVEVFNTVPVSALAPVFVASDNSIQDLAVFNDLEPRGVVMAGSLVTERIGRGVFRRNAITVAILRCKSGGVFISAADFRSYVEELQAAIEFGVPEIRVTRATIDVSLDPDEFSQAGICTAMLTVESAW